MNKKFTKRELKSFENEMIAIARNAVSLGFPSSLSFDNGWLTITIHLQNDSENKCHSMLFNHERFVEIESFKKFINVLNKCCIPKGKWVTLIEDEMNKDIERNRYFIHY